MCTGAGEVEAWSLSGSRGADALRLERLEMGQFGIEAHAHADTTCTCRYHMRMRHMHVLTH